MSRVVRWLAELVELPSINPAFAPPGDARAGEERVAGYVSERARQAGLEVESQPVQDGRCNVLVRLLPPAAPRHRVVLAPHMDTVSVVEDGQLRPRRQGNRLYGRGACDTKASLAAMLSALVYLAGARRRPRQTEIVLAALVDEEFAQAGSRRLAAAGWAVDLAVVGEPTRLRVVTAHKGSVWIRITARGRAAHAATPWQGRNAIEQIARVILALQDEYARSLGRRRHALLGTPTVSVGRAGGGTQPNIVADQAWVELDRRTLPGESTRSVVRELRALLHRHGWRASVQPLARAECPPLETATTHPWVARFLRAMRQRRGRGVPYFCDAAILASAGMPAVVYGPGNIAQAHTSQEWVDVAEVEQAERRLCGFLESLP